MNGVVLDHLRELELAHPSQVDDYLRDTFGERNTLRVVQHRAVRPERFGRTITKRVLDDVAKATALPAAVLHLDELRAAAGLVPKHLAELARAFGDGQLVSVSFNLRTTAGLGYAAGALGSRAADASGLNLAQYIAVTTDSTAPATADTSLTSEITTGGLARAVASYNYAGGGATSYTMVKAFGVTGSFTSVQKAGLFTLSSAGTMYLESTFTPATVSSGDTLTLTWTINI